MTKQDSSQSTLTSKIEKLSINKLWSLYFIAITVIILLITFSQVINYSFSERQSVDADIINKAGRQRMLSQKITKCVLLFQLDKQGSYKKELSFALNEWELSHIELGRHNDEIQNSIVKAEADELYSKMHTFQQKVFENAHKLLNNETDSTLTQEVLDNEAYYLIYMDQLVGVYSDYANQKLNVVQNTSLLLFLITLTILFFELAYVFRPTARRIKKTIQELEKTKNINHEKIQEVDQLYRSLGQAYQHLSESKETDENLHVVLGKVNDEGDFIETSENLIDILKIEENETPRNIFHWLIPEGYKEEMIREILDSALNEETWMGNLKVTDEDGDFVWIEIIITKVHKDKPEILIVGRDTTDQKESEERSKEINQEEIDKHIETQKSRSLLILKGQEEERGRISKDIHDGIGQLLTALKFSLESINLAQAKLSSQKLKESKKLLKNIIREVRRVSFNLSPNTLGDYGINAVLTRFASETSRLSDVNVTFNNKSDFNKRFERHIETNIYRIVQEAVNNAIKYSKAAQVEIDLIHDFEMLYISIKDNGDGFDTDNIEIHGGGNGLLNMKERAGFVGGSIEVTSSIGKGTTISVEVPIEEV
ncbi:ATP-binding protein [Flammeovirga sp. SubArs3]|uniref:sensor histidine kinase n=1 Tax=Flammeovirga sp. SubArs3 TaxID=2995316 RepID=UPI00248C265C|nr:ATP-binding protein [Flammeovirga sp. SubArs3]